MACLNARPQGVFFTGTRPVEITSGGKTRTETVTGGLMVDETATVAVRDTDGTRLPWWTCGRTFPGSPIRSSEFASRTAGSR